MLMNPVSPKARYTELTASSYVHSFSHNAG